MNSIFLSRCFLSSSSFSISLGIAFLVSTRTDSNSFLSSIINFLSGLYLANFAKSALDRTLVKFSIVSWLILSFLDLDWSDAVLDFYKTAEKRKLISTPSYDQVNKPIYSKSVFKWKNYEKNLSEIIPTLKPWLTRFKY